MIKFRTCRYKNILASGNVFTEVRLDAAPTTLMTGKNGSGKSTLIEAITFALFNKPYRKITKPLLVNTINNKALVCEVEFDIGNKSYKIVRGIKPAVFEIWIDGELRNSVPGVDDQTYLEEVILQMNYKTFVQICIIGNATYTPFMQLSTPNRRDIVEDLLDIRIYGMMTELLKKKVSESKQRIKDLEGELSIQSSKIDVQKSYIKNLHDDRAAKVEEARTKIAESLVLIEQAQDRIASLTSQRDEQAALIVEDIESTQARLEKMKPVHFKMRDSIKRLAEEVEFFNEHDDCPVCKQMINSEFKAEAIGTKQAKHTELTNGIEKIEAMIDDLNRRISEFRAINQKVSQFDRLISETQGKIDVEQRVITRLQAEVNAEQKVGGNLEDEQVKLKTLAQGAIAINDEKVSEQESGLYLTAQAMMLKDTGIKAKVIKQYVPIINKLINKYLTGLDFFASFILDENFGESIKARNRDALMYESFSEGEKLKIDLSILFTWVTIAKMKNTVSTNLLMLDEVSDSGLDSTSSALIVGILKEFSKDAHVFVISHHPELYLDHFDRHLQFEKINNYSVLVKETQD